MFKYIGGSTHLTHSFILVRGWEEELNKAAQIIDSATAILIVAGINPPSITLIKH